MHKMALMQSEIQDLQAANEALSKRWRAKKTRLQDGGALFVQDGQGLQDQLDLVQQIRQETQAREGRKPRVELRARRCGNCGESGHNTRTCQIIIDDSQEEESE